MKLRVNFSDLQPAIGCLLLLNSNASAFLSWWTHFPWSFITLIAALHHPIWLKRRLWYRVGRREVLRGIGLCDNFVVVLTEND